MAFARVFSGTLRPGQEIYVLGPRHNPSHYVTQGNDDDKRKGAVKVRIGDIYVLMGREVESIDTVSAGNVAGIGGLESHVLKSATISSTLYCPPFRAVQFDVAPIVRVAVEPVHPSDMSALVEGLKLLNQADSCVEIVVQETGEHVLVTAGEVHLQRCLDDLRSHFAAGVAIDVSEPIVPFRETIVPPPTVDRVNEEIGKDGQAFHFSRLKLAYNGLVEADLPSSDNVTETTANGVYRLRVRAVSLPDDVTRLLARNGELLKSATATAPSNVDTMLREFRRELDEAFRAAGPPWSDGDAVDRIWSLGPRRTGPNVLLNAIADYSRPSVWQRDGDDVLREFDHAIVSGFQLATLAGPLCDEPLMGVAFIVDAWEKTGENATDADSFGPLSGQLISAMKETCRRAFLAQPTRLMMAMYSCQIQATADVLGRLYAVLGRRGGRVLSEEMKEGSSIFVIDSVLPVAESFGFAEEVRKRTSGLASPQLVFDHWAVLDEDPYWVPTTEEELVHFGEKADYDNRARKYMDAVRRRKGLYIEEKTVEHAEKQRTLSKNK